MIIKEASKPGRKAEEQWVEAVDACLAASVKRQLVSDVPLGALLSGGVDSSLVAAAMPELVAFTAGFADEDYSELNWAREVARHLGVRHVWEVVQPRITSSFEQLIEHLDDPLGDYSVLPTFLVCQMAAKSVTVVLSGDGGDELFGGYEMYVAERLSKIFRHVPSSLRKAAQHLMRSRASTARKFSLPRRLMRLLDGLDHVEGLKHSRWRLRTGKGDIHLLHEGLIEEIRDKDPAQHILTKFDLFAPLPRISSNNC